MAMKFSPSTAAFILAEYLAKSADNLPMGRRRRGRGFKSLLPYISVSRFLEMSENRSKSARVRAICAHARTRRTSLAALIDGNRQNLSGRDFARSVDHRLIFAQKIVVGQLGGLAGCWRCAGRQETIVGGGTSRLCGGLIAPGAPAFAPASHSPVRSREPERPRRRRNKQRENACT